MPDQKILIRLVHGAHDAPKNGVAHWSDADGAFAEGVKKRLPRDVRERVSFKSFAWTGANSFAARKTASERLVEELNEYDPQSTLLVGHSHGGAVIADALATADASRIPRAVCTLGTPFIARTQTEGVGGVLSLILPTVTFAILFAAALTLLIYRQGTWATICVATAAFSLLSFTNGLLSRLATIVSSAFILSAPLAFAALASRYPLPFGTFLAMFLAGFMVLLGTHKWWIQLAEGKSRRWDAIPPDTVLPNEPNTSLSALRLPGDEASFAVAAAQAVHWVDATGLIGSAVRFLRQLKGPLDPRPMIAFGGLWAVFTVVAALIRQPNHAWWFIPINGLFLMCTALTATILGVALLLLWARVLTTLLLAVASGLDVLDDVGLVDVYAESLPRWKSHKNCKLEILHWTAADRAAAPPHPSMHQLGFVQQRVAEWIAEKLAGKPVAVQPAPVPQPQPAQPHVSLTPPAPPRVAAANEPPVRLQPEVRLQPQVRLQPEMAKVVPKPAVDPGLAPRRPVEFRPRQHP